MAQYQCCTPKSLQSQVQVYGRCCQVQEATPTEYLCCVTKKEKKIKPKKQERCTYSKDYKDEYCPVPRGLDKCKSRELTASNLMTQCDCVKRNGLQTDCQRMQCKGRPCCLTKPIPSCCPSKYYWRKINAPIGKQANDTKNNKDCKVSTDGAGCNPCVLDCTKIEKSHKKPRKSSCKEPCHKVRKPNVQIVVCQPNHSMPEPEPYDVYCPEFEN